MPLLPPMINLGLFTLGAIAIASPIIIHLLNKRRFKTVDWAAMEFLLEAEKRNRRRVRLENILLLLLRCLAILLIALLIGRPYSEGGISLQDEKFERIVVLDDSLSMQAREGSRSALETAKIGMVDFVKGLISNETDDKLTVILSSRPHRPLFNGVQLSIDTAAEIVGVIEEIQTSDLGAKFDVALLAVGEMLAKRSDEITPVIYIISDMRQRDWMTGTGGANSSSVKIARDLAEDSGGCYLVDVGSDDESNLVITAIIPKEKALVSGVGSRFEVVVKNSGSRDVSKVVVRFSAEDSIPLKGEIDLIQAGESRSIPFTYTFAKRDDIDDGDPTAQMAEPVSIKAEIVSSAAASDDRLVVDNTRFYAARVIPGVPTLIVDGDPSATYGRSESFYLKRALEPPGDFLSGISIKIATEVEFDTVSLDNFQIIYLCNLYHISEQKLAALERWVTAGGGLVFMLGDQIDEEVYNRDLYRDGKGLLPLEVGVMQGDETENEWKFFDIQIKNHPVVSVFEGENNPLLEGVKIFRWWECSLNDEDVKAGKVNVIATYSDLDQHPAIVEKTFGKGRVMVYTTPVDNDWSNFPEEPSYLITVQQLNRYMSRTSAAEGTIAVGETIQQKLDLTRHKLEASVLAPGKEKLPVQIIADEKAKDESVWQVDYNETQKRGFYEIELTRTNGESETILFAANIDPTEGDLKRVDERALKSDLEGSLVQFVRGATLLSLSASGAKGEWWLWILFALVSVLLIEQFVGWWFGLKR